MGLDHNNKRHYRKYSNTWRLDNTLLRNQWVTEEIREEIKMFPESNEKENTIYQNLWDTAKEILMGKFRAINSYIKKTKISQINLLLWLMMCLKLLEKQKQTKPQISRWREIINIRAKINEIRTKRKQNYTKNQ
jgi:tRNA-dihydrouridine synthase